MGLTTTVDLTDYKHCYRRLLECLSAAVSAMPEDRRKLYETSDSSVASDDVKAIARECGELVDCMVVEIREARNE